jgi:two-component system nitrate/nitrite response regulator NarL
LRVLIVDDHPLFIDALTPTLERMGATHVIVAHTAADAIAAARRGNIDVAIVDLGLPDRSGMSVGREIAQIHPGIPIVAVTGVDDPTIARHALEMGFAAFLPKELSLEGFERGFERALRGDRVNAHTGTPAPGRRPDRRPIAPGSDVTPRELEVLGLLVDGYAGPSIAAHLGISRNTVRTHIQSILTKLQVHSRLEAAAFAIEHGLVTATSSSVMESRRAATGA